MGLIDPAALSAFVLAAEKAEPSKTAFYIESSASLRGSVNNAKFTVGTGLYPRPRRCASARRAFRASAPTASEPA